MENKNTLYIVGGLGIVVVLFLLLRRGSGSAPMIISTPPTTAPFDPNQARLAQLAINADIFKNLTGSVFGLESQKLQTGVAMSQIEAGRTLGLAQTSAAQSVAAAQNTLQGQAISAARDVGIAQASADTARAQLQNEALAAQTSAQNRSNLMSGLFSTLGNILRSIGQQSQQQQPRSSTGTSGGSSGGSSAPIMRQPQPIRRAPILPGTGERGDELDFFDFGNLSPINPFENFDFSGIDYFGDLGSFGEPPPMNVGPTNFYVEDPSFTLGNFFDQFGGYYTDPIVDGGSGVVGNGFVFDDSFLGEPPEADSFSGYDFGT